MWINSQQSTIIEDDNTTGLKTNSETMQSQNQTRERFTVIAVKQSFFVIELVSKKCAPYSSTIQTDQSKSSTVNKVLCVT